MDTPVAPFATPVAESPSRPCLLSPASRGLRHALASWRPLLAVLAIQIVLALTIVVPFHARMSTRMDSHAHATALAGRPDAFDRALGVEAGLDPGVWADAKRLEEPLFEGLSVALFFVVTVAWLFGAVAAGGFLGTAVDGRGAPSMARFFAEGGRWFPRMLRVGLCFGLAYLLAGRAVFEMWGKSVASTEAASASDASVWWSARAREAVFVLLFLWLRVVADLARADLVVFGRRSAVFAFFRGIGRTILHPLRTLLPALVLGLPAFLVLWALGFAVDALSTGESWTLAAVFGVLQLAVFVRWTSRAAVLAADARILQNAAAAG